MAAPAQREAHEIHIHHTDSEQLRYEERLRSVEDYYHGLLRNTTKPDLADTLCMALVNERNDILRQMRERRLRIPSGYEAPHYTPVRHHT